MKNSFEVNFLKVCGPKSQAGLGFCLTLSPSSCTVMWHQELCLSLITVPFQVIYIPRAWHYMFIQIFQKVGSYAGYGGDTIWAFPIWSEFSPRRVSRSAKDLPQYQIPRRQGPQLHLGIVTLLELLLIVGKLDHCAFPSFLDEVQAFFQKSVVGTGAECSGPLCWEVYLQWNDSLGPIGHRKGGFSCEPTRCGAVCPQDMGQLFNPPPFRVV